MAKPSQNTGLRLTFLKTPSLQFSVNLGIKGYSNAEANHLDLAKILKISEVEKLITRSMKV